MDDRYTDSKDLFQKTKPEHLLLAQTIERLLSVRRKELERGVLRLLQVQRKWAREWTRAELTDVAYSSYRALLNGKLKNFPSRQQILTIGEYLACTPLETNSLLVAAGYTPLRTPTNKKQVDEVVRITQKLMKTLPMPAVVIAHDWTIIGVNPATLEFLGIDAAELTAREMTPINLLQVIFDDNSSLINYVHPESRDVLAHQSLHYFRMNNILYQHERWYNDLRNRLWHLPRFAALWRTAEEQVTLQSLESPDPIRLQRFDNKVEEVFMVPMRIGIATTPSPTVLTFVPRSQGTSS